MKPEIVFNKHAIVSVTLLDKRLEDDFEWRSGYKSFFGLIKERPGYYYKKLFGGVDGPYTQEELYVHGRFGVKFICDGSKVYYAPRVIVRFSDESHREMEFKTYKDASDYYMFLIHNLSGILIKLNPPL